MKILAAKNANNAKDANTNYIQKICLDGCVPVSNKMVFMNKSFSSRFFACFAAKKVCLS